MSLQDRISAQSKLEADLLLQNERIGKATKIDQNVVLPFKPVDSELLREYNEQFPKGFETTDPVTGVKTFRKFLLPQDEPVLETVDPNDILPVDSQADIDRANNEKKRIVAEINSLTIKLQNLEQDKHEFIQKINTKNVSHNKNVKVKLTSFDNDIAQVKHDIQQQENDLLRIDAVLRQNSQNVMHNQAVLSKTAKANKEKVERYREELNILNSKAFTTEQLPSETEEQYFQRLKNNAEITQPDENLENAKQIIRNQFRDRMRELVRDPSKVEQIANEIDSFGEVANKMKLLKVFEAFKRKWLESFGSTSSLLNVDEIIELIYEFLDERDQTKIKEEGIVSTISEKDLIQRIKKELIDKYAARGSIQKRRDQYNQQDFTNIKDKNLFQDVTTKNKDHIAEQVARRMVKAGHSNNTVIGFGIKPESLPKVASFGKLKLLVHKLYYKNILAIKHPSMVSVVGLKNTKVSEKFVNIIMNILEGHYPTLAELNGLSITEKQLFDRLVYLSGLNKQVSHSSDKTINDLKKKMKLIEGEISAGNNNPMLYKELYVVVHSLKDFGVLSQRDIKSYLAQF